MLWFKGMSLLPWMANFSRTGRWVIAALPLLGLPWFADMFPQSLRAFNLGWAEVVSDMFGDLDKLGRTDSTDPAQAAHAAGARLVWRAGEGAYADTFGHLHFAPPKSPFASPDDALAALAATVTANVGAMDELRRIELLANLERDKKNDLNRAGIVSMPAVKAILVDPQSSAALHRAAKSYRAE